MDDSERSYGYSQDIYHGRRGPGGQYGPTRRGDVFGPYYPGPDAGGQRSYEYGPERSLGEPEYGDRSPEEELHIEGGDRRPPEPDLPPRRRAWARGSGTGGEGRAGREREQSFDWDLPGPHRGRGPRGYRRSNERLFEEVCDRLEAHGNLDASDIEVQVDGGEVTLTGTVPDRRSKRLAEAVAETVRGVVDIHNQLRLKRGEANGGS